MAFSTQKDFFHVPFMNESVEYECKRGCVKLKSYDSTIDDRAWALDDKKQSKFLSDLVTCETPVVECGAEGGSTSFGTGGGSTKISSLRGQSSEHLMSQLGPVGGDSLLECANTHLAEYQKVLNINNNLEKQLEVSEERLQTANEENRKIKDILAAKLDHNIAKDFFNKIQQIKLSKNEENELLQMHKKIEDMVKAYEVLQAENNYVKRLVEKLSARTSMASLPSGPELSTDIAYLQEQVNNLRRECAMLRKIEEDFHRLKQSTQKELCAQKRLSDQDAENIKAIVKERNSLRDKCKSFKVLEKKVGDLQQKEQHLNANLNNQSKYINNMESEIQKMQKYYEDQQQEACFREECLKAQLEELKEDLMVAKCQAQKAEMLQMEVACLRNEILKRDMALADYDCQYKQLMRVVDEIQGLCSRERTVDTDDLAFFAQATLGHIGKELRDRSRQPQSVAEPQRWVDITPKPKRIVSVHESSLGPVPTSAYETPLGPVPTSVYETPLGPVPTSVYETPLGPVPTSVYETPLGPVPTSVHELSEPRRNVFAPIVPQEGDECCKELELMRKKMDDMERQKLRDVNCDEFCAEALERIRKLEELNDRLKKDLDASKAENDRLQSSLRECNDKMDAMLKKLNKMEDELNKNTLDANVIGKDLQSTRQLVKDISDMQVKNQQLATAVNAINSRDDQKIIDDLRKQLEDALNQLKKCQQNNEKLQKDFDEREKKLKELSDLNNKLKEEKEKLAAEMDKLKAERDKLASDKTKLEAERDKLAADMDKLKAERDKLAADMDKFSADMDKLKAERDKLAADKAKLEAERDKLTADMDKLKTERDKLATDMDKLKAERDKLAADMDKLKTERDKLAADMDKLKVERDKLASDLKKLEDEKNKLASELNQLKDERDKLLNENRRLAGDITKLQDERKKMDAENDKLKAESDKLKSDNSKFLEETKKKAEPASAPALKLAPESKAPVKQELQAIKEEPMQEIVWKPEEEAKSPSVPIAQTPKLTLSPSTPSGPRRDVTKAPTAESPTLQIQESPPPTVYHKPSPQKQSHTTPKKIIKPKEEEEAIETFVQKSAEKFNLKGLCFEKELRKILDNFIEECSFCFCRLANPKSKLYSICHKMYHYGISTLSFRELAYLHKKVFKQCEQLLPGFLLNMILTDNAEQARQVLGCVSQDNIINKGGDGDRDDNQDQLKCCCCKSELCCYNSEEDLKEKVCKLERDIKHAKEYLINLKAVPPTKCTRTDTGDSCIAIQATYRASQGHKNQAKFLKQLKSRMKKNSEL